MWWILVVIALVFVFKQISLKFKNKKINEVISEDEIQKILLDNVNFYRNLHPESKKNFIAKVQLFLSLVKITAVSNAPVTRQDCVLIASSGVIPIFHYPNWFYDLNEILIYPEVFNLNFDLEGGNRNIGGMVGDGALRNKMILSLPALKSAFNRITAEHTAIHEFAHLIDKADGSLDGVPELFITKEDIPKWIKMMHQSMQEIIINPKDTNPYATSKPSEFFAIMTEYFFQQPQKLEENYPDVYHFFKIIFNTKQKNQ